MGERVARPARIILVKVLLLGRLTHLTRLYDTLHQAPQRALLRAHRGALQAHTTSCFGSKDIHISYDDEPSSEWVMSQQPVCGMSDESHMGCRFHTVLGSKYECQSSSGGSLYEILAGLTP